MQIPVGVVSRVDLGRLVREIDALDAYLKSAEVRQGGSANSLPKTSKLMDELLQLNNKNALVAEERTQMKEFLAQLRDDAPSIHMSFSADPSPLFTQKLIAWLRQNIHPLLLLQIGLQPTIGAGTIVRTTNKYFDMSLREFFADKKPLLLSKMRNSVTEPVEQAVEASGAAVAASAEEVAKTEPVAAQEVPTATAAPQPTVTSEAVS